MLAVFAGQYLSESENERVRRRVARAAIRVSVDNETNPTGLSALLFLAATLAPWAVGYAYGHRNSGIFQFESDVTWVAPVACGIFLTAVSAIAYLSPRTGLSLPPNMDITLKYRFRAISAAVIVASLILWILIQISDNGSFTVQDAFERLAIGGIAYLLSCVSLAVIATLGGELLSRGRLPVAHPHDRLLLDMVNICAQAQEVRLRWSRPRSAHDLLETIEKAARRAERLPHYAGPLFFSDRQTRDAVASDGLALAALIRGHQPVIIRANGPKSYDRVIESMSAGIIALTDDDWESLMAHALPVSGVSKLRSAVQRIFPPTVMLAAAFLIPLIPQVASSPAVSGSVRVTLMVTAALALILPRESSARAPILDALSKANPIGKSDK